MAHVEFKISIWMRGFGCGEDCEPDDRCSAAGSVSGGGHRRGHCSWWSSLGSKSQFLG